LSILILRGLSHAGNKKLIELWNEVRPLTIKEKLAVKAIGYRTELLSTEPAIIRILMTSKFGNMPEMVLEMQSQLRSRITSIEEKKDFELYMEEKTYCYDCKHFEIGSLTCMLRNMRLPLFTEICGSYVKKQ